MAKRKREMEKLQNAAPKEDGRKNNGGARPGSGRKKRHTGNVRDIRTAQNLRENNQTPLEIMVEAMLGVYHKEGAVAAFPFAEKCAPFMHPKINAIAVQTVPAGVGQIMSGAEGVGEGGSLRGISDEQLLAIAAGGGEGVIDTTASEIDGD